MKELLLGIVVIILLGIGSVLYSTVMQMDKPTACTLEARQCPGGSFVGRTGPSCEFAACPSDIVAFTPPRGFQDSLMILSSMVEGRVGFYTKAPSVVSNNITVFIYKMLQEETVEDVLLKRVVLSPSDLHPESIHKFEKIVIGDREVYRIINERFEASVEVTYGIPLDGFVVLVALRDVAVENWMEDFTLESLEDLEVVEEVVASVHL